MKNKILLTDYKTNIYKNFCLKYLYDFHLEENYLYELESWEEHSIDDNLKEENFNFGLN